MERRPRPEARGPPETRPGPFVLGNRLGWAVAEKILVIEDDAAVAELLQDVLTAEGWEVLHETDGEWGLRTLRSKPIDLVILDVLLPKVQGFELLARIRAEEGGATLPIVMISGIFRRAHHREELVGRFKVLDLLDKPLELDRLRGLVRQALRAPAAAPRSRPGASLLPEPQLTELPQPSDVRSDFPAKGELAELPFARLLGLAFSTRATGALLLRKGTVKKIVYFREGIPIYAKSNLLSECLGRVMVAERLITAQECERSLERKKEEPNKRQGEILMEMGSISHHNLEYALELQLQNKLFDLFSWLEGAFQFSERASWDGPKVALSLGPTSLIHEGASRAMSTERIRRDLAFAAGRVLVPSGDPTFRYQALQLDPRADELLDTIDGEKSLEVLLEETSLPEADAALVLYALICAGLLLVGRRARGHGVAAFEALSTEEIDAVAQLANIGVAHPELAEEEPLTQPRSLEVIAEPRALEASARQGARPSSTPALRIDSGPATPASGERVEGGTKRLTLPRKPVSGPSPAGPTTSPRAVLAVPRTPADGSPALSEEARRQVRARLEAGLEARAASVLPRAASVSRERTSAGRSLTSSARAALAVDLERERTRLEAELRQRLAAMEGQTLYEVLGVGRLASPQEIQAAWEAQSKKLAPDALAPLGSPHRLRKLAEQIYLCLVRARDTLSSPAARQHYDRLGGHDDEDREARLFAAEAVFEQGSAAAARGDWALAQALFQEAVERDGAAGRYLASLAWASAQLDPAEEVAEQSLALLERAAELSPEDPQILLWAAELHERWGRRVEAIRCHRRALERNADCVAALEALRRLEPPAPKKQGLLARLPFG